MAESTCAVQPLQAVDFTMALQGPTVDQLASNPSASNMLKQALADLMPGICEPLTRTDRLVQS